MIYCRLSRIIWGLGCISLLWGVALESKRPHIEADLEARARAALSKAGLSWAGFSFSGRDAVLVEAEFRTARERWNAMNVVKSVYGVNSVTDKSKALPFVTNYKWVAKKSKGKIQLDYFVPSLADKKAVMGIAVANFPGLEIEDNMTVAQGVVDKNTWLGVASFSLKQLSYLHKGQVLFDRGILSIHGRTSDSDSYIALTKKIRDRKPEIVKLGSVSVQPPKTKPYTWTMTMKSGRVRMDGHIPDFKTHQKLSLLLLGSLKDVKIIDNLGYASGQPKKWSAALRTLAEQVSLMDDCDIKVSDTRISITGTVKDEEVLSYVKGRLKTAMPANYTLTDSISVRKSEFSQKETDDNRQAFNSSNSDR